jgi:hypothetical protein
MRHGLDLFVELWGAKNGVGEPRLVCARILYSEYMCM